MVNTHKDRTKGLYFKYFGACKNCFSLFSGYNKAIFSFCILNKTVIFADKIYPLAQN